MKAKEAIKKWWEGTYVPEPPGSPFLMGSYERHWTSSALHSFVRFYLEHWKWLWPFMVGVVGLIIAITKG